MQLGNILSTACAPIVPRDVTFCVLGEKAGQQTKGEAKAVFVFVPESIRDECKRLAREWLEGHGYKDRPIPHDIFADEVERWFLLKALRNKDDHAQQFCFDQDYGTFKAAVTQEQCRWLMAEHERFTADEYPELATPKQQADLVKEAASWLKGRPMLRAKILGSTPAEWMSKPLPEITEGDMWRWFACLQAARDIQVNIGRE